MQTYDILLDSSTGVFSHGLGNINIRWHKNERSITTLKFEWVLHIHITGKFYRAIIARNFTQYWDFLTYYQIFANLARKPYYLLNTPPLTVDTGHWTGE